MKINKLLFGWLLFILTLVSITSSVTGDEFGKNGKDPVIADGVYNFSGENLTIKVGEKWLLTILEDNNEIGIMIQDDAGSEKLINIKDQSIVSSSLSFKKQGNKISIIDNDGNGIPDIEAVFKGGKIDKRSRLVFERIPLDK